MTRVHICSLCEGMEWKPKMVTRQLERHGQEEIVTFEAMVCTICRKSDWLTVEQAQALDAKLEDGDEDEE